jgi:glucose/arabinose dehydrogenase
MWCQSISPAIRLTVIVAAVGAACGRAAAPPDGIKVEVVAEGLDTPWAIDFLPNGDMLFTERPGQLRIMKGGVLDDQPVATITRSTETGGEGGLMGLAVHPDFEDNGWIYMSFTESTGSGYEVKVVRWTLADGELKDSKTIIDGIEGGRNHDGCALGFGPDGKLYITTGERYRKQLAKDLGSLNGKTLRLNDDGSIPKDNPFITVVSARPEIFSYGHRNAQGIDWHPDTGVMYQSEHGPSGSDGPGGGDEINLVKAGANYGWPDVSHERLKAGTGPSIALYTPAVAPGACAFYTGSNIPEWEGSLLVACLRGSTLIRLEIDGDQVVSQERLFKDTYGRLRAVAMGPDGSLYFSTSNKDGRARPRSGDDKILRVVPGN